ncbi:hypothetical protein [Flavilitoribacter nigricans]|uniref:Uncharacterized protein n=1 Tax=Flavilitoribacter nigricans (strain ATCC 23147 / DSM 23189 / NBRC 102662 / NCIMB 1420 / SS-2) TaxID=1122177 RepID=A0A2D0MWB9_FLAN2|nr:hypothetical protein [Flavilitoribacter nigricans]PHN00554.1 hypothetical protein CRP01_41625 [Flavilitoribacter nigricans DSM 23189 = NBRC 102662]
MNPRVEKVYKENRQILDSIIGLEIKSAIEEQYFFEGKLQEESRGTLKLEFSTGEQITLSCDADAESIRIQRGGFLDKSSLEKDFKDGRYHWKEKEFLRKEELQAFGYIQGTEIEITTWGQREIQTGCRLTLKSGDFIHIWTTPSDNIFYGINHEPIYDQEKDMEIRLKK